MHEKWSYIYLLLLVDYIIIILFTDPDWRFSRNITIGKIYM